MRARLARPRRTARGRIFVPVAAAAAVALVGGVVVAVPNAPTVHSDVQTVANAGTSFNAGAEVSFDLRGFVSQAGNAGIEITDVTGLPDGLTFDATTGMISGVVTTAGVYTVQVVGTLAGNAVTIPVTVTINNADGTAPAEGQAGGTGQAGGQAGSEAAIQGSLGGEAQAGGQLTTGSEGADTIIGAVSGIVAAVTGNAGSTGTGTGTGETAPDTDAGPLGSMADGQLDLGSLGGGTPTTTTPSPEPTTPDAPSPEPTTPAPAPGGSSQVLGSNGTGAADGEATGEATGGIDTQSLGPILGAPLASLGQTGSTGTTPEGTGTANTGSMVDVPGSTTTGDTTTGGDVTVPGSTTSAGSLGDVAPGLAITGAALLGLAGLSLLLNAGSSTPGSTSALPALPGSSTGGSSAGDTSTGETLTGGSGDNGSSSGGSNGEAAPTVAAGAPAPKDVPGPTVANGRG